MATKTFKIGLSDTDKQNMAQDVYERLLALTFSEYNSSETYNTGDFVVYDNALYQCQEDNVTGTWDSTKWASATLQDLLDDVESAVDSVADKANVDGNYPTLTVGVADQLSPYDEDSGDDQDEPFILQGTGTANGTQSDFSTGAIALMREKQGNTVVVNQVINPTYSGTFNGITCSTTNGVMTLNGTASAVVYIPLGGLKTIINHKYLVIKNQVGDGEIWLYNDTNGGINTREQFDAQTALLSGNFYLRIPTGVVLDNVKLTPKVIDLTQWFNGDIPADIISNPENFFRYYQGSLAYNTGTLVNADGRYIKCIGMNQWDEEWELGGIDGSGNNNSDTDKIRAKNYIRVIPNTNYYYKVGTGGFVSIAYYDKDKNFILRITGQARNSYYKTPANACYMRFYLVSGYGTTYNNDVSINLYYEDEARCLTYEPYQVLTNNDTGTEVLRSAGSVKDTKTPDGTIHRLVDNYTFTGLEDFRSYEPSAGMTVFYWNGGKTNWKMYGKMISDLADITPVSTGPSLLNNKQMTINNSQATPVLYIRDDDCADVSALLSKLTGHSINVELYQETTEQGTPFSENLVIDDFGSIDFGGTSDVPQGNLIFYPVDYKAFIDTLYNYTDGTPSNIALKSDLPTAPQTFLESISGYDATKTQTLKNVEGVLTWVDDE